jgi:RNA polymerase sigma factor (sigma-70 family)
MEASSLTTASPSGVLARRTPLLRLQPDERLVALIREGHDRAFEVLFNRYQSRLLAFCRHLVGSPQDAEDVLQEVFAAAHAAILADDREIDVRPWLYRIARNRCISHLRRPTADGVDSMDVHPHENGTSTLEQVQRREELRAIVSDVHELPETQRTALVLRAIDDLSYRDIAQTMGTTLPSVKSLMVRARMSLSQSIQARGALAPLGLLALLRKLFPARLGGSSGAGGTTGTAGSAGSAGSAAGAAGGVATAGGSGVTLGGALSAASTAVTGIGGALGAKAAVGVATAALLTAGAVGVNKMNSDDHKATPSADRVGTSASSRTTGEIGSSTLSPRGANARAAGATVGVGQGRGPGTGAGRAAVDHAHSLKTAVGHVVGRSPAADVSDAARNSAHALTPSLPPAVSNGTGAVVKPPKSVAPPGPGPILDAPRRHPVRPPSGHPLPLKPPKPPLSLPGALP